MNTKGQSTQQTEVEIMKETRVNRRNWRPNDARARTLHGKHTMPEHQVRQQAPNSLVSTSTFILPALWKQWRSQAERNGGLWQNDSSQARMKVVGYLGGCVKSQIRWEMPSQDYGASCGDAENLRVFCEVGDVRLSEVGEIQKLAWAPKLSDATELGWWEKWIRSWIAPFR